MPASRGAVWCPDNDIGADLRDSRGATGSGYGASNYLMRRVVWTLLLALGIQAQADYSSWASVKRKFELIQTQQVPPGSRVRLKQSELNGYVEREVEIQVPEGVRDPRVELGNGTA